MVRGRGERIYDSRVKINKKLFNALLLKHKKQQKLTWFQLGKKMDVSEHTIKNDWRRNNSTIPLQSFAHLLNNTRSINIEKIRSKTEILDPFWGQKSHKSKFDSLISLPNNKSELFAEFYGILLGDGCLYSNLSGFCVAGHKSLDANYLEEYTSNMIQQLFNLHPKIYFSKNQNAIRCVLYNKKIVEFLMKNGFPLGEKKHKASIPLHFFRDINLLKRCIKGLFDTDGSIYSHKNVKIVLEISVVSPSLFASVKNAFKVINFDIGITKNRFYLYGADKVSNFMREIGSANQKHLNKYHIFLKEGRVPRSFEMENLLKEKRTS